MNNPESQSAESEEIERLRRYIRRIAECPEAAFGHAEVMETFRDEAIKLLRRTH